MKISLLHATKRPEAAKACQKLWLERAENPANIEIITCVDADDEAGKEAFPDAVLNTGEGVCPAWNEAAEHATGDVFVVLDDDWECPQGWDQIIESYMCNGADILHVGDKHRKDQLICHPIISKRFFEAMGYLWHPLFRSVYCDNWMSEIAKRWGYVDATKDGSLDLGFLHKNPSQNYGAEDDVARISNSQARYEHGRKVFDSLMNQKILAFTVAGRPDHLEQSLNSWLQTNLELVTAVHFFIEPIDAFEIDSVIDLFASRCPVPVIKHWNKEKLGVLRNPWHLFDHCFRIEGAKFVILGEDDFLVSPDTLDFLCGAKFDDKTMAVCAKWVGKGADNNPETWHRSNEFTGNIWGTTPDVWSKHLRDTWDFDYSSGKADETSSGWDWNIQLRVMPQNGLHCIVPTSSRSKHIGITGAHCTKEVFDDTVAWNFLAGRYDGAYREVEAPANKPTIPASVSSVGDLGDICVSLSAVQHSGKLVTYYLRENGMTKGRPNINVIGPLLEAQPYIAAVKYWTDEPIDWASEGFRPGWHDRLNNLSECHSKHAFDTGFLPTMPDSSKQWLFVEGPKHDRIVVNRSHRYNNQFFPWREIVAHYGSRIVFIGTSHEHQDFCASFGTVEYRQTGNLLDVARLIVGSPLFIGNQSSCMTIAEGLKHPRILEGALVIPDCVYAPDGKNQYVFDGCVVLPDIGGSGELKMFSKAIAPENVDTSIVPTIGRIAGWQYQVGDVLLVEGNARFLAKKVSSKLQIPYDEAYKLVVEHNVRLAPSQLIRRQSLAQFSTAARALTAHGWKDHSTQNVARGVF